MTEILNEFWGLILIVIGIEMLVCNLLAPGQTCFLTPAVRRGEIEPKPAPPDDYNEWLQFVYEYYASSLSRPVRELSDQDKRAAVQRWIEGNAIRSS
jgi:hypothetical protein